MTPEELQKRAQELVNGLSTIPVQELVDCARDNLKATRRIRLSKESPEGFEEPDYNVRQKALEWIGGVIGVSSTAPRKPKDINGTKETKAKPAKKGETE